MTPKPRFTQAFAAVVTAVLLLTSCGTSSQTAPTTTSDNGITTTSVVREETTTTSTTIPFEKKSLLAIGNSLSWDTLGGLHDGYLSMDVLARQSRTMLDPNAYHINCGASLLDSFTNPTTVCVDSDVGSDLNDALRSDWEVIWLQPYPGPESTLDSDEQFFRDVRALHPDAEIYLLAGWPSSEAYGDTWTQPLGQGIEVPTELSRAYFDELSTRLLDINVVMVPIGEVMYELNSRLEKGDVPVLKGVADLYRDEIHLNNLGQWVAGTATAAVILSQPPTAFGKPGPPWYGPNEGFSADFIRVAREAIETVLMQSQRS